MSDARDAWRLCSGLNVVHNTTNNVRAMVICGGVERLMRCGYGDVGGGVT
jgi:hypothetical protein